MIGFLPGVRLWYEKFGRLNAPEQGADLICGNFTQGDTASRQRDPGGTPTGAGGKERHQMVLPALIHERGIANGARCDDAADCPLNRSFGGGRVSDLFADGDRLTGLDQTGNVLIGGVERHAGHRCLATLGEGDIENACCLFGIALEQLVEIAEAIEEQGIGYAFFNRKVLTHHWRQSRFRGLCGGVLFAHIGKDPGIAELRRWPLSDASVRSVTAAYVLSAYLQRHHRF